MKQAYSFDDVLLVPKRTFGGSRSQVDLSTTICGRKMQIPILSANMSSVTEANMAVAMRRHGGLGILHRMCSIDEQLKMVTEVYTHISDTDLVHSPVYVSVEGTLQEAINRILGTCIANPFGYCIDIAHADSPDVEETVKGLVERFPSLNLIIGNYATPEGIFNLIHSVPNLDLSKVAFKVGIGSGSQCTTRVVTGCGLPTFESLQRIRDNRHTPSGLQIIADGGFKNSGDIVKALAAGANAVMLGSLLAGTKETPGNVIKTSDGLFKVYRGSASYGQKFEVGKNGHIEGEESLVPYKSQLTTTITQLVEGMKSGFSYCGALNIEELKENAEFVHITNSGYKEGTAHGA